MLSGFPAHRPPLIPGCQRRRPFPCGIPRLPQPRSQPPCSGLGSKALKTLHYLSPITECTTSCLVYPNRAQRANAIAPAFAPSSFPSRPPPPSQPAPTDGRPPTKTNIAALLCNCNIDLLRVISYFAAMFPRAAAGAARSSAAARGGLAHRSMASNTKALPTKADAVVIGDGPPPGGDGGGGCYSRTFFCMSLDCRRVCGIWELLTLSRRRWWQT